MRDGATRLLQRGTTRTLAVNTVVVLTHYTKDIESIVGILTNGFAWVANRRHLIKSLVPQHDFSAREPQQFGMISFTEIPPGDPALRSFAFGRFGIIVPEEWAHANRVERVIYVSEEGPAFETWRYLFGVGYRDLMARIEYPDDKAWLMSFENKAMASAVPGAMVWAHLLQLYEYMEHAVYAPEREWRIVQRYPHYSIAENAHEALAQVSPPEGWARFMNFVKVSPKDVRRLVCPREHRVALKDALPLEWRSLDVTLVDG